MPKSDLPNYEQYINLKLNVELNSIVTLLLNRLEYISMLLMQGIANSKTVYQSLHQTFFSAVIFLYFNIAFQNKDNKDKYFVNTISLYNEWYQKYLNKEKDEKRHRENLADAPKRFDPIK